jgi:hypothetical protein
MPEEVATPATTETATGVAGGEGKEHVDKQRIYVAGKMMFFNAPSRDWRGLGRFKELEWRSEQEALSLLDKMRGLRDLELEWDDNWVYVGPHFLSCPGLDHDVDYFYQLDDEPRSGAALASVLRDEQRDFTVDEREKQVLYDNARHQISKCDVLYARLTDQKDCFWAFVEIGIAAALGTHTTHAPPHGHSDLLLADPLLPPLRTLIVGVTTPYPIAGKRVYIDCPVESHDTWLLPHLSEQSKGTRYATCARPPAPFIYMHAAPPHLWPG